MKLFSIFCVFFYFSNYILHLRCNEIPDEDVGLSDLSSDLAVSEIIEKSLDVSELSILKQEPNSLVTKFKYRRFFLLALSSLCLFLTANLQAGWPDLKALLLSVGIIDQKNKDLTDTVSLLGGSVIFNTSISILLVCIFSSKVIIITSYFQSVSFWIVLCLSAHFGFSYNVYPVFFALSFSTFAALYLGFSFEMSRLFPNHTFLVNTILKASIMASAGIPFILNSIFTLAGLDQNSAYMLGVGYILVSFCIYALTGFLSIGNKSVLEKNIDIENNDIHKEIKMSQPGENNKFINDEVEDHVNMTGIFDPKLSKLWFNMAKKSLMEHPENLLGILVLMMHYNLYQMFGMSYEKQLSDDTKIYYQYTSSLAVIPFILFSLFLKNMCAINKAIVISVFAAFTCFGLLFDNDIARILSVFAFSIFSSNFLDTGLTFLHSLCTKYVFWIISFVGMMIAGVLSMAIGHMMDCLQIPIVCFNVWFAVLACSSTSSLILLKVIKVKANKCGLSEKSLELQ